jgi:hypothetical protein
MQSRRHCEPTGPRFARPDDRLREAIQLREDWIASSLALLAMTDNRLNRALSRFTDHRTSQRLPSLSAGLLSPIQLAAAK